MAGTAAWSTPADVVRRLRRRWDRGEFLSQFAGGREWVPLDVGLRGPSAADLAARFGEVQSWVDQWQRVDPRRMRVETRTVGGRVIGANDVPSRVWIDSYDQLWSLLGVTREVRRFTELLAATRRSAPRIAEWMTAKPLEVLRFADEWDKLVDTVLWIDRHATREMYLRQVDVPGVDTKFIERRRKILAALLDRQLPEHRIDATRPPSDFAGRYRFRAKPGHVRFRRPGCGTGFTELSVRVSELAATPLEAETVFVVENEITYLAFPDVESAVVIFGEGYAAPRLEPLTWLAERTLVYWGDIDTHGFAILNRLRRTFGHTRSMLMDRATLLAHEEQWIREPSPTNERLESLRSDETALYHDLVEDTLGPAVRLEQERVRYSAIEPAVRQTETTLTS